MTAAAPVCVAAQGLCVFAVSWPRVGHLTYLMETLPMRNNRRWMAISAVTGLAFFLIANLTDFFVGLNVVFGLLQIVINIFVFVTWLRGYRSSHGRERFLAFFGVIAPPILAGITLYRVIIPFFTSSF